MAEIVYEQWQCDFCKTVSLPIKDKANPPDSWMMVSLAPVFSGIYYFCSKTCFRCYGDSKLISLAESRER
jgi:hypothetical protein